MVWARMGVLVSLLVVAFTFSQAGSHKEEGKRKGWKHGPMKGLNLSKEQREQFKKIREETKEKISNKREELRETREAMQTALKGAAKVDNLDAVRPLYEKVQKLKREKADMRFNGLEQLHKILNEEQREKFHSRKKRGRGKKGRGHMDEEDL